MSLVKATERRASSHLKIKKENYQQIAHYMGVTMGVEEDCKRDYEAGEMVRIAAEQDVKVEQAVALFEVNPVLLEKGFCSHVRVADETNGVFRPEVLVRFKDDLKADELQYLFKVYLLEAW